MRSRIVSFIIINFEYLSIKEPHIHIGVPLNVDVYSKSDAYIAMCKMGVTNIHVKLHTSVLCHFITKYVE